jgi:hypothetical protein
LTEILGDVLGRAEEEGNFVDILYYGRSGAGKTRAASTAPQPMYVLSGDITGHKSIPYQTPGIVVRNSQEAFDKIEQFYQGGHGYKTLLIDAWNGIYDKIVRETGQLFHQTRGSKDPDLLNFDARTKILLRCAELIQKAVELTEHPDPASRMHVIFTMLEERVKEGDEAPFMIRPLFGTKTMNERFPGYFTVIGYIAPKGTKAAADPQEIDQTRFALFTEYQGILARDRLSIFPPRGEAPNLCEYLRS